MAPYKILGLDLDQNTGENKSHPQSQIQVIPVKTDPGLEHNKWFLSRHRQSFFSGRIKITTAIVEGSSHKMNSRCRASETEIDFHLIDHYYHPNFICCLTKFLTDVERKNVSQESSKITMYYIGEKFGQIENCIS